jgi:GLPGLI family protein
MKKIFISAAALLIATTTEAQQTEGKVIYERTMQLRLQINDNDDHLAQAMPQTRVDKFELNFAGNKSLWKHVDEDNAPEEVNNGGMQIRMVMPGQDDIVFCNFDKASSVEQREFMGKKFLVNDSIKKMNWKLGDETKSILGHLCRKAVAQRIGKRTMMNLENGKMERKEFDDTTTIVAWFTTDIPVSAGPEVQGQLPGLILALDMNSGRITYIAKEIAASADVASIKEPAKGTKVTPEGFKKERDKMMEEMEKNSQGPGQRVIKISN